MTANNTFWEDDWFQPHQTLDQQLSEQLGFLPGFKEVLKVRQIHALEHGTVWALTQMAEKHQAAWRQNYSQLGGMSTEKGFYLYGSVDKTDLYRAVSEAGDRLRSGEWDLALHPRCGTNLYVTMLLTAGLAGGFSWLLPKDPLTQIIGVGGAAAAATVFAPEVGRYAQRYITTAIPFNLVLEEIDEKTDLQGKASYFVRLRWQNSQ